MPQQNTRALSDGRRRRAPKACKRCRDQKIRCTGTQPCPQCRRRGLSCYFEDETEKVVVSRRYVNDLHQRISFLEQRASQDSVPVTRSRNSQSPGPAENTTPLSATGSLGRQKAVDEMEEAQAPLTNPLAFHTTDWVPGPRGEPVFMGTSSNWAFGRRVLNMTHERLMGVPLPPDNLLFDTYTYDLQWDGNRLLLAETDLGISDLPTQDFAVFLINSVKFHCGRLYYLFDEELFMKQFALFHENPVHHARREPLWYVHYLLILAFGKAFLIQSERSQRPAGTELFVHAMRSMPDFTFYNADPIEKIQVLCCAALYLQCLNHRPQAHRVIGQALREALSLGMHTEMRSIYLDDVYVQRSHTVWWTVYVLERQITSLLGLPMGITEEKISTPFPVLQGQTQKSIALQIQVQLARVLAKIDETVYGVEGKLDSRYLGATQMVLRLIAEVTERLESSFDLHANEVVSGISRISAHLHLLRHQCVILTTRPLLYIFLQSRLGETESTLIQWLQSGSVKGLIQICVESAQQILKILSLLLDQGLLETFLTFDLDATYTATIAILMTAAIDPSLLSDYSPWSQRAHSILSEMASHGNRNAALIQTELRMLQSHLDRLLRKDGRSTDPVPSRAGGGVNDGRSSPHGADASGAAANEFSHHSDIDFLDDEFGWNYELSAEQLMNIANSLDLESLTFP